MKSELDILSFNSLSSLNGHDYFLSSTALQIDEQLFQHILGKHIVNISTFACITPFSCVHLSDKRDTGLLSVSINLVENRLLLKLVVSLSGSF